MCQPLPLEYINANKVPSEGSKHLSSKGNPRRRPPEALRNIKFITKGISQTLDKNKL